MLGLGTPEWSGWHQFRDDPAKPKAGRINIGDGVFRDRFVLCMGM